MTYKTSGYRNEAFRRAVAQLACQACGREGLTQAAHSNSLADGKGMGTKSSDVSCMALCVTCHHDLDQGGHMNKVERRQWELEINLKTLRALFTEGLAKAVG